MFVFVNPLIFNYILTEDLPNPNIITYFGLVSEMYNKKSYICFLVMAACSIANIVKSSLGPVGLDKMLVDDIGVSFNFRIFTMESLLFKINKRRKLNV